MLFLNEDAVEWHKNMKSTRGGKREGSGRKPKGDQPKAKLNISIDPELLKWIDQNASNRSEFVENLLQVAKENIQVANK
jgi:hypothetical protein